MYLRVWASEAEGAKRADRPQSSPKTEFNNLHISLCIKQHCDISKQLDMQMCCLQELSISISGIQFEVPSTMQCQQCQQCLLLECMSSQQWLASMGMPHKLDLSQLLIAIEAHLFHSLSILELASECPSFVDARALCTGDLRVGKNRRRHMKVMIILLISCQ